MNKLQLVTILILMSTFISCSSGSDDDDDPPGGTNSSDITYEANIKPIMTSKCIKCHKIPPINNAPMSLTTYQNVKDAVNSRSLIRKIESGNMPPSGAELSDAQVELIKDWKAGGFIEN